MWLSVLVFVLGLALFVTVDQAKYPNLKEIGRIMLFSGLFVALLKFAWPLSEAVRRF